MKPIPLPQKEPRASTKVMYFVMCATVIVNVASLFALVNGMQKLIEEQLKLAKMHEQILDVTQKAQPTPEFWQLPLPSLPIDSLNVLPQDTVYADSLGRYYFHQPNIYWQNSDKKVLHLQYRWRRGNWKTFSVYELDDE